MHKPSLLLRIVFVSAIIIGLLFAFYISGISTSDLSPQFIQQLANDNMLLIALIMLLLMTLQNLFTFLPLILIITLNISFFGFSFGYIFSTFSSVFGSTAIFLCVRYIFADTLSQKISSKYEAKIQKNGFLFVLSGRILPFLPTNLINIASGLSTMKVSHFIAGTALGNAVYGFVLASLSFGVVRISAAHKQLFFVVALIVAIAVISWRLVKHLRASDYSETH